ISGARMFVRTESVSAPARPPGPAPSCSVKIGFILPCESICSSHLFLQTHAREAWKLHAKFYSPRSLYTWPFQIFCPVGAVRNNGVWRHGVAVRQLVGPHHLGRGAAGRGGRG